uniref:VOC domain-containing protein n=1 Tax=Eucampia antarctica TaxID=49252 RepID=A0A7S2SJT0_9STRA|mmetsp:Transcript_9231/g.8852  ORF Transcript_9231/g.8852 Transcript_9231/m.8852 type:complete len:349 (+) Transcript_9231:65-1111(+)|eukprot:CAMPEP_0197823270 /NCGR_PEP_ID=MMETSP1437-20131217/583_1 /TAXON_ID=49252 ORGANISM="Eucampia antarctica, Strain CCMP1452" /NCGR_SAMPLE_ID=MMETSP1437 /ASSEMBLY_ACC=CAM_ASM_001096 /LENGTH=348 /DNA_ID=CAMNT_0043422331 /DNA_START=58 /DNA_END=1104 /DNA_ORIENTATION=+
MNSKMMLAALMYLNSLGDAFMQRTIAFTRQQQRHETMLSATATSMPIDILGIDHVVLKVDELEKMTEWYSKVLGMSIAKHNVGAQMVHLDAGDALIDLVDRAGPLGDGGGNENADPRQRRVDHICLAMRSFDEDAIRAHLLEHSVEITTELGVRYGKGGAGESIFFLDPEGNRIEIKQSKHLSTELDTVLNKEQQRQEKMVEKEAASFPIDILGIDHVVLKVSELKKMTEWYNKVLGTTVAKHNEKMQMMHLDAGSGLIDLVDRAGPLGGGSGVSLSVDPRQRKVDHICLALSNFDESAIRAHLLAHDVEITTELGVRYGKGGDGESIFFLDPEGNRIEIKESKYLAH